MSGTYYRRFCDGLKGDSVEDKPGSCLCSNILKSISYSFFKADKTVRIFFHDKHAHVQTLNIFFFYD